MVETIYKELAIETEPKMEKWSQPLLLNAAVCCKALYLLYLNEPLAKLSYFNTSDMVSFMMIEKWLAKVLLLKIKKFNQCESSKSMQAYLRQGKTATGPRL